MMERLIASGLWLLAAGARVIATHEPFATIAQAKPPSSPVIVKIITPPHDPTGISDVIIGAIGLTGFIVVLAIVLGLMMAGILFWFRSRNPLSH